MSTAFYVRSRDEDFLASFDDDCDLEEMYQDMLDYAKGQGFTSVDHMLATSTIILDQDLDKICNQLKTALFTWDET